MRDINIDDILKINEQLDAAERALDVLASGYYGTPEAHSRGILAVHNVRSIVRRYRTASLRRGVTKLNPKTTKRSDLKKKKDRRVHNKKTARTQRRKHVT